MTLDEALGNLIEKYGDEFTWDFVPYTQTGNKGSLMPELRAELSETHPLYYRKIHLAVARCYANDDVLFLGEDEKYFIIHLTYSKTNLPGFPVWVEFSDLNSAITYIEEQYSFSNQSRVRR